MSSFDYFWLLLETHGVIPNKKRKAEEDWNQYPLEVQRYIYRCIRDKIRAGKFVNYDPVLAIMNNLPPRKQPEPTNYRGRVIPTGLKVYSAKWNGSFGMYTAEDIARFGMEIAK